MSTIAIKFTDTLWSETESLYKNMISHPLVQGQRDGTLSREAFRFYLEQEIFFALDFAQAVALISARASDPRHLSLLSEISTKTSGFEKLLAEKVCPDFPPRSGLAKTPTCLTFTSLLTATSATKCFKECLAMLLACLWIYRELGIYIYQNTTPTNPYKNWLDCWVNEDFQKLTDNLIDMINEIAEKASPLEQRRMIDRFAETARYELAFLDSCYHQEEWEI